MFDTHCHLTFDVFRGREADVLDEAGAAGVRGAITVGTTSVEAQRALELAEAHANVWCSAGVHPLHCDEPLDWDAIERIGRAPKCVAWGELGLDHHYERPPRDLQRAVLEDQLRRIETWTAAGLAKPVIVHSRNSFDDLLAVFGSSSLPRDRYVFHCFTGDAEDARRVLDFGAWISFTGVVTFRNAPEVREAARLVPDDRIMVETDAPFLSPEPVRSVRPNVPAHVVHTARRIADLRGVSYEDFEAQVDANAERFFGLRGL